MFAPRLEVARGLRALHSAYRQQRPLESRISALGYAPVSNNAQTALVDEEELRRAETILVESKKRKPTAQVFHALGEVYLTQTQFDKAIREFDEARKRDPNDKLLLSDLGAAWLEKAKLALNASTTENAQGAAGLQALGESLSHLNRALAEDSNLVEAIFNRALCFQYLRLPVRAEEAWREYLEKDSSSPWANEARNNLKLLGEQVSQSSQTKDRLLDEYLTAYKSGDEAKAWKLVSISRDDLSGTSISQQLLDRYLDASLQTKTDEASRYLEALSYVAQTEVKKGDEHYNSDLVRIYKSLTTNDKSLVVKARNLMRTGFELYEHSPDPKAMLRVFNEARDTFAQAGDLPEVNHADFWIAYTLGKVDTQRAQELLIYLASSCSKSRYRWLLMRTTHYLSSVKYNLKEYSKSIEHSLHALSLAGQVGDEIGAFDALDVLTEVYRSINNYTQAFNSISRSQPLLECCAFNPIKVLRHYSIVAVAFYSAGSYAAAIEFQKEALRRAQISRDFDMICLAYAHLGLMYEKLGNHEEALKSAKLGHETAAQHAGASPGTRMTAYTSMQLGHLYREVGDCENAIRSYDESISTYETLNFPTHLYQAHKGRLVCYVKQKNHARASEELQTTLALINGNRSKIFEDDNRNKFFDIEQNIYELGISFTYDVEKDGQKAFTYSEASRARSLLDLMLNGNTKTSDSDREQKKVFDPLPLSEIQRRLPAANQIVEYTVVDDKTLIWVINQQNFQVRETKITRAELESRVQNYLQSVSNPRSEDTVKQGQELFDLLIRPVEGLLDPQKKLHIVPDKFLNSLPFNSLVSSTSNRFLIEDYCISYAPSATVLVLASEGALRPEHSEKLLAVGNPTFDRGSYPTLFDLKDAAREARDIKKYYEHGAVLIGSTATKRRVLAEIAGADVAHLALHSIEERNAEMHSRLVLAKESSDSADDVLEAREIYELRLSTTKLVVLSACQTGVGRFYGGEGTFSLAHAFLVSGVPMVVASLWPVDSESTADLMIQLHQRRKEQHLSTAEALRSSQLNMLRSADVRLHHPYYWAAFSILGGSENSSDNTSLQATQIPQKKHRL